MSDSLNNIWNSFFSQRTKPLNLRFPGSWRAIVVETNDPLRMRRIRFKIPELHDWNLKPEECPWAVASTDLGTKRCGRFSYPCIGDYVWIQFEKNHPYGPIYTGFSDPTRRKFYPLPSVHGKTQIPVDAKSETKEAIKDYDEDYLPKDERPMSHGWQDRYGNLDIHNSTGFHPVEHNVDLPPPDADSLSKSKFEQSQNKPSINDPDSKYMARLTKYGMMFLQADMGYKWFKPSDDKSDSGEFSGDFDGDEQFEIDRWLYLQKVIHEDKPSEHDQRRMLHLTRYGHKLEFRDVGWNKTRSGEWLNDRQIIGDGDDQRWIKVRTKGGHLIQLSDIGNDPEEDNYVKRLLLDEAKEEYLDKEDQFGDDARFIRFVTRSGIKFVLDDRTSDTQSAEDPSLENKDIGTGVLIKGRATPGTLADNYGSKSGDAKGYYWQFDETPGRNSTTWGTPMGQVIEMDDNEEFLAICSRIPNFSTTWKNLEDNEFLTDSADSKTPWSNTHHLLIDHGRELIRFKTRAGSGEASKNQKLGSAAGGTNAGLEVHDAPADNPWSEMLDIDKRGIWFSRKESLGIWRAKEGTEIAMWFDDKQNNVVIRNNTSGKIQIFCQGNVDIISNGTLGMQAPRIDMQASEIRMNASGTNFTFGPNALRMNGDIFANNVNAFFPTAERPARINGKGIGAASGGGATPSNLNIESPPNKIEPDNRL